MNVDVSTRKCVVHKGVESIIIFFKFLSGADDHVVVDCRPRITPEKSLNTLLLETVPQHVISITTTTVSMIINKIYGMRMRMRERYKHVQNIDSVCFGIA